jgi:predicted metal-dependent phosphotriesterase family hydrolase
VDLSRVVIGHAGDSTDLGYLISRDVLPALRRAGVTEEQIHLMLVGNPRRVLARQDPY